MLGHWDTGPLAVRNLSASPATIWAAVRPVIPTGPPTPDLGSTFGMEITVSAPDASRRSLPALTKVLVDGCIAALHDHDGTDWEELAARVAAKAGLDRDRVVELLQPLGAPLGTRRLLHRFGAGVQWNPADDLCVTATLRLQQGDDFRIAGTLLSVDVS